MWIVSELCAQRGQWPRHIRCPGGSHQWLPGGLLSVWLDDALSSGVPLWPLGCSQKAPPTSQALLQIQPLLWAQNGILVSCRRCVPSLSMRLYRASRRCHLPECWHASGRVTLHFPFPFLWTVLQWTLSILFLVDSWANWHYRKCLRHYSTKTMLNILFASITT